MFSRPVPTGDGREWGSDGVIAPHPVSCFLCPFPTALPSLWPGIRLICVLVLITVLLAAFLVANGGGVEAEDPDYGNDIANAEDLTVGTPIIGDIDPGTDVDYFKIDLRDRTADVELRVYAVSDFDSVGIFWDISSSRVATNNDSVLTASGVDFFIAEKLAPGIYYISVASADDMITGAYTLHTTTTSELTVPTSGNSSNVEGIVSPAGDEDWFKIDLSGNTADVDFWAYASAGAEVEGTLYDANLVTLDTDYAAPDFISASHGFLLRAALSQGVYYIRVRGVGGSTGSYSLVTTSAGSVSIATDGTGDFSIKEELDVFKLDLSGSSGPADVWISATGGTDTLGRLLDAQGRQITSNNDSIFSTVGTNFTIARRLRPAVYYVMVGNAAESTGAYTLTADIGSEVGGRIKEVKDDPSALLSLGTPINAIISPSGDQDTYKLVLNSETDVFFYTETDGLDTIGALFDEVGGEIELVDDSDLSEGETDLFIGQTLESGTYYIAVVGYRSEVGPYRLHVEAATDPTSATAVTLDVSTGSGSVLGFLNSKNDQDHFTFTHSGTKDVFVYTYGPTDTKGAMGSVENDDGGLSVGHSNFFLADNVSGSRTITVSGFEGDTGPYRVFVETADDQGDTTTTAATLVDVTSSPPSVLSPSLGLIGSGGEQDWFKLDLTVLPVSLEVFLYTTGKTDTKGTLLDSSGNALSGTASDDDSGVGLNFLIRQVLTPAVYYLKVEGFNATDTGPYALFAEFPGTIQVAEPGQSDPPAPLIRSIGSPHDQNWFRIDLSSRSGATDIYISSDGLVDSFGRLYDSNLHQIATNDDSELIGRSLSFNLRESLAPGVYYLNVSSFGTDTGAYWVLADIVSDPSTLSLGETKPGNLNSSSERDRIQLDLGGRSNVILLIQGISAVNPRLEVSGHSDVNEYTLPGNEFLIRDDFSGNPTVTVSADSAGAYTIQALDDARFTSFVTACITETNALVPPVGDALYSCQWHLEDRSEGREDDDAKDDQDINVELVWGDYILADGSTVRGGIKGQGINIAVVDDGMDIDHPDLSPNVDRRLNWDYGAAGADHDGVDRPGEHHGTAVAGVIAARDNSFGVRGVAPRATIYSYNFLAEQSDFSEYDSMARNMGVTAVSNNSWGPSDGPGVGFASTLWEKAVEKGVTEGYEGKGVFYVFAAGNGALRATMRTSTSMLTTTLLPERAQSTKVAGEATSPRPVLRCGSALPLTIYAGATKASPPPRTPIATDIPSGAPLPRPPKWLEWRPWCVRQTRS